MSHLTLEQWAPLARTLLFVVVGGCAIVGATIGAIAAERITRNRLPYAPKGSPR